MARLKKNTKKQKKKNRILFQVATELGPLVGFFRRQPPGSTLFVGPRVHGGHRAAMISDLTAVTRHVPMMALVTGGIVIVSAR